MSARELLRFLEARGVRVSVDGEQLRLNAPKGVLDDDVEALVTARRQELIDLLKDGGHPQPFVSTEIQRVPRHHPVLASSGQTSLWYLDQVSPGDTAYIIIHSTFERGPLDPDVRERALNALIARHESLRTTFQEIDGLVYQKIAPELVLAVGLQDLRSLSGEQRDDTLARLTAEEARRPFDLAHGPLLRYQIYRLADDAWQSVFAIHHIVFDGWSLSLFNKELAALSAAILAGHPSPLPDLPIQFADYAAWQREQLSSSSIGSQLNYWREQLAEPLPVLQLPCSLRRRASRSSQGAVEYGNLPGELRQAIEELARRHRATPFVAYLAAFKVLLHRYSIQDDLLVGAPVAGRNRPETHGLLGLFVNTLVLRTDASGNPPFAEFLSRVRKTTLDAFSNQDVPFAELVRALKPDRVSTRTPMVQVMFNLINLESEAKAWDLANGTSKFDLTLTLVPTVSGMQCVWEYSVDVFDAASIRRLVIHFQTLLSGIVADPERRILELPLISDAESQQVLAHCSGAQAPYPEGATLLSLFQAQVARTPDAPALRWEGSELSYGELNARSNRLARRLRQMGVAPGTRVGVCLERSFEVWVSLLGILKAGAAYVPMDPSYPHQRLTFMLANAKAPVLVTQKRLVPRLPALSLAVLEIDSESRLLEQESAADLDVSLGPDDVAYLMYTSGSTGQPKGVEGTHRGAVNRFAWMWEAFPFEAGEVACQKTSLSFVDSIWELLGPLLQGISTVVVPDHMVMDPRCLVDLLAAQRVSRIVLVPSLLRVLLDLSQDLSERLSALRLWVTSGEAIPTDLAQRFRRAMPHATLLNLYGSSEVSADVSAYIVTGGEVSRIPIGIPIANTQIYVLDTARKPVPIGVPGELYVGGPSLARGYADAPGLTAERFVSNPFSSDGAGLLFRTGDLGFARPDRNLDLLGRLDDQVKVRGMRIELGEIEVLLRQQEGVSDAAVTVRSNRQGDAQLVAYVEVAMDKRVSANELRVALRLKLPDYMIPATIVQLTSLPRTSSGKVNRLGLPDPSDRIDQEFRVSPRTETETRLVTLWKTLLGVESVGVRDGFFDVGGYSLLAVRLFAAIEKDFGKRLPIAAILDGSTIEYLARLIDSAAGPLAWPSLVPLQSAGSLPPFFCVHPIDGDVFWYLALASHVGSDQPFYGLRARGLDGLQEPHRALEDAAADYIAEIKQIQPHGPYYLGGYSWGATIAFEMAQQLQARGDEIGLLASIDSPPAITNYFDVRWGLSYFIRWLRDIPRRLARLIVKDREDGFTSFRRTWSQNRKPAPGPNDLSKMPLHDRANLFATNLSEHVFKDSSIVPAYRKRVISALYQASVSYSLRQYAGKVTVFRAAIQPVACEDPFMDWARLALAGVDVQTVPGEHGTILLEPSVRQLGEALVAALANGASAGSSRRHQDAMNL